MDARSYGWCSLGPLAPEGASLAADHAQQTGVRMIRGTIVLEGIHRPAPGTVVYLAYSDGQNWLARLPYRLRVISSFCNAWAEVKTTTVSVGCDLRYFDNRKQSPQALEAIKAEALRIANGVTVPDIVKRVSIPPIKHSWVVNKILADLGLTTAGPVPLLMERIVEEFDMTAGYIAELGKLCDSESYICYMNAAGQVAFQHKDRPVGNGVLITKGDLADFNPINTGDLPGDAVYARYTTTKLVPPTGTDSEDKINERNWERDYSQTSSVYRHAYSEYINTPTGEFYHARNSWGHKLYYTATGGPVFYQKYEVKAFEREQDIQYLSTTTTETKYDDLDRVSKRRTVTTDQWGQSVSETTYTYKINSFTGEYNQAEDELIEEVTTETSPLGPVRLSMGLQAPFAQVQGGSFQSSRRQVLYEKNKKSGITRTRTRSWTTFMNTPDGSETLSRLRDRKQPWDTVEDLVAIATRIVPEPAQEQIRTERQFGIERRPVQSDRTSDAWKDAPDIEESVETTWAIGSVASQTAIELSPPYVSDDKIVYTPPNTWVVVISNAQSQALKYAQIENSLLLGHRNGSGIQVLPEILTGEPLQLAYIRLNGCTGAFLLNGVTINVTAEGASATADALFWGAVDGTLANAWFPLPPDTASLPSTASVTTSPIPKPANAISIPNGFNFQYPNLSSLFTSLPLSQAPVFEKSLNPASIIPPYKETISTLAGSGTGCFGAFVPWGSIDVVQSFASGGAGAFGAFLDATAGLAGAGAGIFGEYSGEAGGNFEVTWSQSPSGSIQNWGASSPSYSSTATTSSMTITYNNLQEYGLYYNTITVQFTGTANIVITSVVNGTEIPGFLVPQFFSVSGPTSSFAIDSADSEVPSGTMTMTITLVKT